MGGVAFGVIETKKKLILFILWVGIALDRSHTYMSNILNGMEPTRLVFNSIVLFYGFQWKNLNLIMKRSLGKNR